MFVKSISHAKAQSRKERKLNPRFTLRLCFLCVEIFQTKEQTKQMSAPVQKENSNTNPELDQLCINTIRALTLDAVQKAQSGHPGLAARRGADGLRALDAFPATQPAKSEVGKSRSVSAFRRSWLDVALFVAASDWLRSSARRTEKLSAVGFKNAGPSGIWTHAWRRDHDRPARPGLCERRWHGDGRRASRCEVQQRRISRSSITTFTRLFPTAI